MNLTKYTWGVLLFALMLMTGCSGVKTPVTVDSETGTQDTVPFINLSDTVSTLSAIGLMGVYELTINTDTMTADLVSKRFGSIGESWVLNGISYFTITPCQNCLNISGISITPEWDVAVTFSIKHPFEPGDILKPPTAKNRLDLDVFDVALVIAPSEGTIPTTFPQFSEKIYDNICVNPDGYTLDLFEITEDDAALPFFLVVDENDSDPVPAPTTWNKFGMGATEEFDVTFSFEPDNTLRFDLYLAMGYGNSATRADRLVPKYYNPEFNRKAAWKVVVTPPEGDDPPAMGNTWKDNDSTTFYNVKIEVFDWQTDAVVSTETDFTNADPSEVFASSEVSAVHVEIAGMALDRSTLSVDDGTGTGMPGSPLVYYVPVRNENLLEPGEYPGLVTVVDNRIIGDPDTDTRDYLIDCPDGINLSYFNIPAFQTYQTFTATVVNSSTSGYCWTKTWGGTNADFGRSLDMDQSGNAYVTGSFVGTSDFNPDGGGSHTSNGGCLDVYLSKFDSSGNWQWTKTWGGSYPDVGRSVSLDQAGNVYVTGFFHNTVDFNPDGGGSHTSNGWSDIFLSKFDPSGNWQWTKTCGGIDEDWGHSVSLDQAGNVYVTGFFEDKVDFNPDSGEFLPSNGDDDVFLSKFDSSGNWQWTKTWGGTSQDRGYSVSLDHAGNVYVTGDFWESVDFNPDGGGTHLSNGELDAFLSKFDSSGNWLWTKTWGGSDLDRGFSISMGQADNAYVTGYFSDIVDFNPDGGGTHSSNGESDIFLSKFDSSGNWKWTKTWGGASKDKCYSVSLDQADNSYVTGAFRKTVDFNPDGGETHSSSGTYDTFLSKLDSSGNWLWSKTWGGADWVLGFSVSLDQAGSVYVLGEFQETADFNPEGGDIQSSKGSHDVFLWKGNY